MQNIYFDLETIPSQDQSIIDEFMTDAKENFKAPSGYSKKQALEDMGLDGTKQPQKYWTKDEALDHWAKRFKDEKCGEVGEQNWLKTSLDGTRGEIISASFCTDEGDPINFYRELNSNYTEYHLLGDFFTAIHKACRLKDHETKPFFVGTNIASFDLKFMMNRAVILRQNPGFDIPMNGRHESHFWDVSIASAGYGKKISQDNLARAYGIPQKPGDIDGSKVWGFVKRGNAKRVAEYNNYDVETVREIYNRQTFRGQ